MIYCLSSKCTYHHILPYITMSRVMISFSIFKHSSRMQLTISFDQFVMCFQKFCIYVFIETQPLKQHINTLGTRREIRILAYSAFYHARIQETLETSGVTKSCSQPFSVIGIVDRINCCSVLI